MKEITLDDVEGVYQTIEKPDCIMMILKNQITLEVYKEEKYYYINYGKKIYLNEDIKKLIEFGR